MSDSSKLYANDWSSALAEIGELVPIDETARKFKAFLRARGVKSASDLLRLALVYAIGNSLRGSSAWAQASATTYTFTHPISGAVTTYTYSTTNGTLQ